MLAINLVCSTLAIVICAIVFVISLGLFMANDFTKKQNKKYEDCINIIKEKGNNTLEVKISLTKEDIHKISPRLNIDNLMENLYNTYLKFEKNLKNLYTNFDGILTDDIKLCYEKRVENYKSNNYREVIDEIDLLGYSITQYEKDKLKFRININCFNYKEKNDIVVSGSNSKKTNLILLVSYEKNKNKWLISNYERVYEKLSD